MQVKHLDIMESAENCCYFDFVLADSATVIFKRPVCHPSLPHPARFSYFSYHRP